MIEFRINGVALVMFPGTSADLETTGIVESLELGDDFVLPLEVPNKGNEATLGFVHELMQRERTIMITGAEMVHNGSTAHGGVFYVEGSSKDVTRLTFTVDGILGSMKELKLKELDLGELIRFADLRTHAAAANALAWPASPYCFPTFLNTELYGSANEAYYPSISAYRSGGSYPINTLATYPSGSPVARVHAYQSLGSVSGDPINFPSDWREVSFGLVNRWDPVNQEFYENTVPASYYAMVPCFYLKELVKRAMAHYNYTVSGSWFNDVRFNPTFLTNNTALDAESRAYYFRTEQTADVTNTGASITDHVIPCDDDSTAPNEDAGAVWNPGTFRWLCPAAGTFRFKVRVKRTANYADQLLVRMVDTTTDIDLTSIYASTVIKNTHDEIVEFNWQFDLADVGRAFYFTTWSGTFEPVSDYTSLLSGCWVEGYQSSSSAVNAFTNYIDPRDHVPDMNAAELLLEICTAFCVRLRWDGQQQILYMDSVKDDLDGTNTDVDITDKVRSTIEIDHVNRPNGITLGWDSDAEDMGLEKRWLQGYFDTEEDLPTPLVPSAYAVVINTRQVFLCDVQSSGYVWIPSGWLLPDVTIGNKRDADVITCKLAPTVMERVFVDGEIYLVPQVEEAGNSKFFRIGGNAPKLRMANYHGLQNAVTGALYPYASPFNRETTGAYLAGTVLDFSDKGDEANLLSEDWALWADTRINGEEWVFDTEVDAALLYNKRHTGPLVVQNQRCVMLKMPISYTTSRQPLIARGARYLKVPVQ